MRSVRASGEYGGYAREPRDICIALAAVIGQPTAAVLRCAGSRLLASDPQGRAALSLTDAKLLVRPTQRSDVVH
jgi:hypothetical protein